MSLRDFFRRHRNVFSISTDEVDVEPGDDDMLVEEYGERAVEARRLTPRPGLVTRIPSPTSVVRPQLDVSEDEIADAEP